MAALSGIAAVMALASHGLVSWPNWAPKVMARQAAGATTAALLLGKSRLSYEVPPRTGRDSYMQYYASGRDVAAELSRTPALRLRGSSLYAVLPNREETARAAKRFGCSVAALPAFAAGTLPERAPKPAATIFVAPGFNTYEYNEVAQGAKRCGGGPTLVVNGQLERTTSGYYPRAVYSSELYGPGVQEFYKSFTAAYIVKAYPEAGGYLLRAFPEPFQLFLETGTRARSNPVRVGTMRELPAYAEAIRVLREAAASGRRQ